MDAALTLTDAQAAGEVAEHWYRAGLEAAAKAREEGHTEGRNAGLFVAATVVGEIARKRGRSDVNANKAAAMILAMARD